LKKNKKKIKKQETKEEDNLGKKRKTKTCKTKKNMGGKNEKKCGENKGK